MKKIFLAMSLPISLLATDISNYKQPERVESQQEKLNKAKQQKEEIRRKLSEIPGLQKKIIAMQETIKRASDHQRKLADTYAKANKFCEEQKAKNELKGMKYTHIEKIYKDCQEEMKLDDIFSSDQHNQLMTDIKSFKQAIQTHIEESDALVNKKEALEMKETYISEAILMLEESVNNPDGSKSDNEKESK